MCYKLSRIQLRLGAKMGVLIYGAAREERTEKKIRLVCAIKCRRFFFVFNIQFDVFPG